jgi:chorismate mutase
MGINKCTFGTSKTMAEDTLKSLRKEIDQADDQLLKALVRRMDAVQQVGVYKKENNIPPLDESRWREVLDDKIAKAQDLGLSPEFVEDLYQIIHKHALKLEEDV